MKTVDVNLGERAYQIHIGSGLIANAAEFYCAVVETATRGNCDG